MTKKGEDSLEAEKLTAMETLVGEIVFAAMHATSGSVFDPDADPKEYQAAFSKVQASRQCLINYGERLAGEKIEITDAGSKAATIDDRIKARNVLQEEIEELDLLYQEVKGHLLPETEAALEEIRKRIDGSLHPAIEKTKEKYEVQLAKMISEASDIIFSLVYGRPVATKLN